MHYFKKVCSYIIILAICVVCFMPQAAADFDASTLSSKSALLINADTGEVLFEKNADQKSYPASTTKLMTALLAIEKCKDDLRGKITVSSTAVNNENLSGDGSSAGLLSGEVLTLHDVLCCLLIHSGNDSANVLAEYVSGSVDEFVARMNQRAVELGCTGTHYVNPHGEHDVNHYTTAKDMALILKELLKHKAFREISGMSLFKMEPTNKFSSERIFSSNNKLVVPTSVYYYSAAKTGKTGYTTPAGCCLCSSAEKDGMTLICISFGAERKPDNTYMSFIDQKALYNWGFSLYSNQNLISANDPVVELKVKWSADTNAIVAAAQTGVKAMIKSDGYDAAKVKKIVSDKLKNKVLEAPIEKGQVLGTAEIKYGGVDYGKVNLIALSGAKRSTALYVIDKVISFITNPFFICAVIILAILIIIYVIYTFRINRKRKFKSRKSYYL